jgi:DNA polymerase-3 subunit delta
MSAAPAKPAQPLALVCGDDEYAVKQLARQLFTQWCAEFEGMDHETIDGQAGNSADALKIISRAREAIQTLPFFGGGKVVWLKDCTFFGDDRTASTADVTETLASFATELKDFKWGGVRLLISAGKVDKRKSFYKTLDKAGVVQVLDGWSVTDKDWADQAEAWSLREFKARGKQVRDDALAELVGRVGPNPRLLGSEIEKLTLYAGERTEITTADVSAVCIKNKFAQAFAVGDALGDRNLPRLLQCLDEELWEMQFDKEKSEFGILAGLVSKVRTMLLVKEIIREGWIKPASDYSRFKAQLTSVPTDQFPEDKRYNPLTIHPFVLFRSHLQAANYSTEELVRAMDLLLRCNMKFFSRTDSVLMLQQTLVQIASR